MLNFSYGNKLARLQDLLLTGLCLKLEDSSMPETTCGPLSLAGWRCASEDYANDNLAQVNLPHKLMLQQVDLFNFMELGRPDSILMCHFGSNFLIKKPAVNIFLSTFLRRANDAMEFRPGNCLARFCIDNFNGDGDAKPSDGKTLRVSPSITQCSDGIWSGRGEVLGHLFTVGEMSVKGHQHKSIHTQVKQVNPAKFKLRLVRKSICQVNRLSLVFAGNVGRNPSGPEALRVGHGVRIIESAGQAYLSTTVPATRADARVGLDFGRAGYVHALRRLKGQLSWIYQMSRKTYLVAIAYLHHAQEYATEFSLIINRGSELGCLGNGDERPVHIDHYAQPADNIEPATTARSQ
ncbi:hypothetical protein FB451DRAFT_1186334 [Mycena latifolia]|nr:hypothetical protein FB451DRAFT_1186334 [Mycena latifolia]